MTYVNKYSDLKYKYKYKYPSLKYEYEYKYWDLKYKYKYFKLVLEYKYKYQVLHVCSTLLRLRITDWEPTRRAKYARRESVL